MSKYEHFKLMGEGYECIVVSMPSYKLETFEAGEIMRVPTDQKTVKITFRTKDGYVFTDSFYIMTGWGVMISFDDFKNGNTEVSVTANSSDFSENMESRASEVDVPTTTASVPTAYFSFDDDGVALTIDVDGDVTTYTHEDEIEVPVEYDSMKLTFHALPNRIILPDVSFIDGWGVWVVFDVSDDGLVATTELKADSLSEGSVYDINISTQTVSSDVVGFNNVYRINGEGLRSLSKERFHSSTGEDVNTLYQQYVINVLELPFDIGDSYDVEMNGIVIGSKKFETKAMVLDSDVIRLDLGTITTPLKYNNSYDYSSVQTYLHLPFTEKVELPVHYVLGETISVEYVIDLYGGDSTLNVSSTVTDTVVYSKTFKIGRDVPFVIRSGDVVGTLQSVSSGVLNHRYSCMVEVVRNDKYDGGDSPFDVEVNEYVRIGDCKGYIEVENINLISDVPLMERNMILDLLRTGIEIR